jgi:drug/metabolite transporter (DMT)-like permease|tara:strand:+ start:1499 stop:2356 length:858 start_codon:yes stop_codon:yes gene_type:complete
MLKLQKGFLWMLIATLFFSLMGATVKLGSEYFSPIELVFYRSATSLIFIFFIMNINKVTIKTDYLILHFKRSLVGFISLLLFFYAIGHLPLSTAISLNYTSPLFLGILLPFILNRKLNYKVYAMVLIGFIGVFLILKPTFNDESIYAGVIGLFSGLGAAVAYLYLTQLGQLKEPDIRTVFYFTLISTIGSAFLLINQEIHTPRINDFKVLIGLGASATIAQIAITRAYRIGNTLGNASLSYLTIIFSAFIGILLFKEIIDYVSIFGMLLIITSGTFVSIKQSRLK